MASTAETEPRPTQKKRPLRLTAVLSFVIVVVTAFMAAYVMIVKPRFAQTINVMSRSVKPLTDEQPPSVVQIVSVSTEFPVEKSRLPKSLKPEDYFLKLDIDLEKDFFKGILSMVLLCVTPTNAVIYHGVDLDVKTIVVTRMDDAGESIVIRRTMYNPEKQLFYTELADELQKGERIKVEMTYNAEYSKQMSGLYISRYKDKNGQQRPVATGHMEPTDARRVFPCLDEPEFKAKFHISIIHDKSYISLSNMPIESVVTNGDKVEDHFLETKLMSTYLVAFAVVDFVFKEAKTESGMPVRCYAPPHDSERIQYAADSGAKIISFYEKFFGVKYPLPKLDLLAVPDFLAGAMEDWGLVSFRNAYLIYDQARVPLEAKKQITMVIAHELAHQWFGNLVTMKWWNDIWLNEGFANFVELLGTNEIDESFCALDLQIPQGWQAAITLDSLKNSHPISQNVQKPSEIDELFDAISYNKGAAVLRMLQSFMGKNAFISGVKSYIRNHAYGNAATDDLWKALSQSGKHLKIKQIMDTWAKQRGFPVLEILQTTPKSFTVRQQAFLKLTQTNATAERREAKDNEDLNALWYVPFTYTTDVESDKVKSAWLNREKSIDIKVPAGFNWIKGNMESNGFYVINYSETLWHQLILQLNTNHKVFDVTDRANLIHDAFKLACENVISPTIPLEMSKYLIRETDYLPWSMARAKYDCLSLLIKNKKTKTMYKEYFWHLQSHLVNNTMLDPVHYPSGINNMMDVFQRYEAFNFALKFGFRKDYTKLLQDMFVKLKHGIKIANLSAELRSLALIYGSNHTSDSDWKYLYSVYINSEFDADRKIIMRAFSLFFKDETKMNRVLQMSLDVAKVRAQDTLPLLVNIVKMGGRHAVWEFITKHWKTFKERYGNGYQLGNFVSEVAGGFTTTHDLQKAKSFLQKNPISHENSRTEKQTIEKIMNNLKRQDSHTSNATEKTVERWIQHEMQSKNAKTKHKIQSKKP